MSDEPIPSLAEALTELRWRRADNERLREEIAALCIEGYRSDTRAINEGSQAALNCINELATEIRRLRARVAELEAAQAMVRGTLERATTLGPVIITHNVPPSAPPHGEPETGHE